MDILPDAVARRERTLAALTASFACALSEDLRFLAFTTPASFREPEIDNGWHPYLIRRGFVAFLLDQLPVFLRSCAGGVRRFILGRFGGSTLIEQPGATVLAVTPASTCRIASGRMETSYVHPDDVDRVHWLVLHDTTARPGDAPWCRVRIFAVFVRLLAAWARTAIAPQGDWRDWAVGVTLLLRWVLHGFWAVHLMHAQAMEHAIRKFRPALVFCVHEVWPHARVLWSVAQRVGVRSTTVQHASIRRTKLWYFPDAREILAGQATPETFAVFSAQDRALLTPYYPQGTALPIVCGPRYAHWKTRSAPSLRARLRAPHVLFVSSIPWWDIAVLVCALERLAADGVPRARVVVRLHPAAAPRRRSLRALRRLEERAFLERATGSLDDDLADASIVIGMNTTVLEEAALIGRAVLVLTTDRFLSFAPHLGVHREATALTWDAVHAARDRCTALRTSMEHEAREGLGIAASTFRLVLDDHSTSAVP
ncbi:MAG: hypothetical protein Q7T01_05155 [bacterium]|nr:hypothetical protein [bacterium]